MMDPRRFPIVPGVTVVDPDSPFAADMPAPAPTWGDRFTGMLDSAASAFELPFRRPELAGQVAAEATGVPSVIRGGEGLYDGYQAGNGPQMAQGAGELVLGAIPGLSMTRLAATPLRAAGLSALGGGLAATAVPDEASSAEAAQAPTSGQGSPFVAEEHDPVLEGMQKQLETYQRQRDEEYNGVKKNGTSGVKGDGPGTRALDARIADITRQMSEYQQTKAAQKLEAVKLAAERQRDAHKADLEEHWWRPYIPNVVGAGLGLITGGLSGRVAGGRQAATAREFESVAKGIPDLLATKGNVVGKPAGDDLAAKIDAAYRVGGAVPPGYGTDIARVTAPTGQQAVDRAIARGAGAVSPQALAAKAAPTGWRRVVGGKTPDQAEALATADAVQRARGEGFGSAAGMFDRVEPFEDTTGSTVKNFAKSLALPAAFATEGAVTQGVIAPRYKDSDPEFANLLDRVANASYVAAGASKLGQMGGKATVGAGRALMNSTAKKGAANGLKPSASAVANVEAGKSRMMRDLGTFTNKEADAAVKTAKMPPAVPVAPAAGAGGKGPALPTGAVGASPQQLALARAEKQRLIANAHTDSRVDAALPGATKASGEFSVPKFAAELKKQGVNVTRAQAARMARVLKANGKI